MTSEPVQLLDTVLEQLERTHIPFALIGATALAVHGVSRSTLDIDLLATDRRLLEHEFWHLPAAVTIDIRIGDAADPLAGVVRCGADGERDVDIIIGKAAWQNDIIARSEPTRRPGRDVRAARVEDLILLKLYAGGSQDRWDIEQLLSRTDRAALVTTVTERLAALPVSAQHVWRKILDESQG
jgi:hypothetical protein